MNHVIEKLPIQFAGLRRKARVPVWAKAWNVTSTTLEKLRRAEIKPGIVVIQSVKPSELMQGGPYLPEWDNKTTGANPYLVVEFSKPAEHSATELAEVLRLFPGKAQVEFAYGPGELKKSLTQSIAKYWAQTGAPKSLIIGENSEIPAASEKAPLKRMMTTTDALGEAREVIAAIRPLLAASGRLSAPKVAELFGFSTARLGELIGSTRQALGKTPDAPAIQEKLRPLEHIARLLAVFGRRDFRAWLHRKNYHLDDHTPMEIIESKRAGVVADLVESMLTGASS